LELRCLGFLHADRIGGSMQVGDLVIHFGREYGIIIHLRTCKWDGDIADVLFEDGEYQVECVDLEVINEKE